MIRDNGLLCLIETLIRVSKGQISFDVLRLQPDSLLVVLDRQVELAHVAVGQGNVRVTVRMVIVLLERVFEGLESLRLPVLDVVHVSKIEMD